MDYCYKKGGYQPFNREENGRSFIQRFHYTTLDISCSRPLSDVVLKNDRLRIIQHEGDLDVVESGGLQLRQREGRVDWTTNSWP